MAESWQYQCGENESKRPRINSTYSCEIQSILNQHFLLY